ncbi:hypothetical protein RHGRI_004812 [Rhododendron griersonianum]|uniref:Uncharacterized protein n=1 Tax=Rhododendron griersonianum TaxID=479676 RepID=A0AAV6LAC9_9ERIC|nr:hypothetical protein RHGRI_004812 [Rhododendron griersonianum]
MTTPPEDDMELYEVPITWEIPPPAKNPEYLSPTKVPTPPMEDFEQPFNFPIFGIETDPELEAALLDLSQYSLEPIMEPPVLMEEERNNRLNTFWYWVLVVAAALTTFVTEYERLLRQAFDDRW